MANVSSDSVVMVMVPNKDNNVTRLEVERGWRLEVGREDQSEVEEEKKRECRSTMAGLSTFFSGMCLSYNFVILPTHYHHNQHITPP
jgi:hypothetical protein